VCGSRRHAWLKEVRHPIRRTAPTAANPMTSRVPVSHRTWCVNKAESQRLRRKPTLPAILAFMARCDRMQRLVHLAMLARFVGSPDE
jgi:hypothetical protein